MRVTFTEITFNNKALLWEYNVEENKAQCLLLLEGSSVKLSPKILEHLSSILGIEIQDQKFIISNVEEFCKTHTMTKLIKPLVLKDVPRTIEDKKDPENTLRNAIEATLSPRFSESTRPRTRKEKSNVRASSKGFFSPGGSVITHRTPDPEAPLLRAKKTGGTPSQRKSAPSPTSLTIKDGSPILSPRKRKQSLQLNEIINEIAEPSLWGKTLCYETHFIQKKEQFKPLPLFQCLKDQFAFKRQLQSQNLETMNNLRSQLIIEAIRPLFDTILDPIFQQMTPKMPMGDFLQLKQFFQEAILRIIELHPDYQQYCESSSSPEESIKHFNEGIETRINYALLPWLTLFNSDSSMSLECLTTSKNLLTNLDILKEEILKFSEENNNINIIFEKMKQLHSQIEHTQLKYLENRYNLILAVEKGEVPNYISFDTCIKKILSSYPCNEQGIKTEITLLINSSNLVTNSDNRKSKNENKWNHNRIINISDYYLPLELNQIIQENIKYKTSKKLETKTPRKFVTLLTAYINPKPTSKAKEKPLSPRPK